MLVHPGGPFWINKDAHAWSIPKGELGTDESPLAAARREFQEETGFAIEGKFVPLAPVQQNRGKLVHAFAVEGDCDATKARSNTFAMEWPPKSGKMIEIPEVDRAQWFGLEIAAEKIIVGQTPLLAQLRTLTESK